MSFKVVIPARYGSTRLPAKALLDIAGRPMIQWVIDAALRSSADEVLVATDDARVAMAAVHPHGAQSSVAVMTSAAHQSGTDRIAEVAQQRGWDTGTIVVNVQGDEPMIDPKLIDAVATLLEQRPEAAMSTAAHPIDDIAEFTNPNVVKVVLDANALAMYFSRAPIPWWRDEFAKGIVALPVPRPLRHIGIYGYRAGFLRAFPSLTPAPVEAIEALEQLRAMWHGHRIAVHVWTDAPGIGVDTPEDLERVRALWQSSSV